MKRVWYGRGRGGGTPPLERRSGLPLGWLGTDELLPKPTKWQDAVASEEREANGMTAHAALPVPGEWTPRGTRSTREQRGDGPALTVCGQTLSTTSNPNPQTSAYATNRQLPAATNRQPLLNTVSVVKASKAQ